MSKLSLKIVTPERIVFEDTVDAVSVWTEQGEITILKNHIPLTAPLRSGEVRAKKDGEELLLAASTGFLQVRENNEIVILADTAERVEELELAKIEEAKAQAKKTLSETRRADSIEFADAAATLERELARYRVALKRKRK